MLCKLILTKTIDREKYWDVEGGFRSICPTTLTARKRALESQPAPGMYFAKNYSFASMVSTIRAFTISAISVDFIP